MVGSSVDGMEKLERDQRRLLLAVALLGLGVLLAPFPGSLSVVVTRAVVSGFSATPGVELLSEVALAALAFGVLAALLVRRPWRSRHMAVPAAVVGVVTAYVTSEITKLVVAQPRPCARWTTAVECPPPGDWSFPSNHAVLAFGAVVVIALALRRLRFTVAAVAVAFVVGAGRIMQGAHYLHDVAAGALLGLAIPLGCAVAVAAIQRRAGGARRPARR